MKSTTTPYARQLARLRKEAERPARRDQPETLRLSDFAFCPDVFQPRIDQTPLRHDERFEPIIPLEALRDLKHVEELATVLRNRPAEERTLAPILVYAIGRSFYVLDGNHRLAAYEQALVYWEIPVEHFAGTLEEAIAEAIRRNSKAVLVMTAAERNEAAWRLVSLEAHPVVAQVEATGLSKRSILRMRKLHRTLAEELGRPFDGTYREALAASREDGDGEFTEEETDQAAAELAHRFGKVLGRQGSFPPAVLAKALIIHEGDHYSRRVAEEIHRTPLERPWGGAESVQVEAAGELEVPLLYRSGRFSEVPGGTTTPTRFVAHTDGSCLSNPGFGGFAAVVRSFDGETPIGREVITAGEAGTTNNRQELRGAIAALRFTAGLDRGTPVTIVSDSKYVIDGASRWLAGWKVRGWKKADRKPVENQDLWQELDASAADRPITWLWVRGHNGDHGNEEVDRLANEAAQIAAMDHAKARALAA